MNIYEIKDRCRANFNEYLRRALANIPALKDGSAMDIGCGTGVSVLEMLQCTHYRVIAVDPDKASLDILQQKVQQSPYAERLSIINAALETLQVPEGSQYIVLAEGLFNIIGFEKGLNLASRFLTEGGYMIIHDEYSATSRKLQTFTANKFALIASFGLNEMVWGDKYISCLERGIASLKNTGLGDAEIEKGWQQEIAEINMYKADPSRFRSKYYIVQKM